MKKRVKPNYWRFKPSNYYIFKRERQAKDKRRIQLILGFRWMHSYQERGRYIRDYTKKKKNLFKMNMNLSLGCVRV